MTFCLIVDFSVDFFEKKEDFGKARRNISLGKFIVILFSMF